MLPWIAPDESCGLWLNPLAFYQYGDYDYVLMVSPDIIPKGYGYGLYWLDLDKVPLLFPRHSYVDMRTDNISKVALPDHVLSDGAYNYWHLKDLATIPWRGPYTEISCWNKHYVATNSVDSYNLTSC